MGWFTKFKQQYYALLKKLALLAFRNWKATILRLTASFFILFLLFLVDQALQRDNDDLEAFKTIRHPERRGVESIPNCGDNLFLEDDCYDFFYAPQNDSLVNTWVEQMRANNGDAIPESRVLGFNTSEEADMWLAANPRRVGGGVLFETAALGGDTVNYAGIVLQYNGTTKFWKEEFEDLTYFLLTPLQLAASREVSRYFMAQQGDTLGKYDVGYKVFAHPADDVLSIVGGAAPLFLLIASMFGFTIQLQGIVQDKQDGLKQALRTMGMMESAYWLSLLTWETFLCIIQSLFTTSFGYIFQFDLWLNNSFWLLFFTFFLFQAAMTTMAFAISPWIHNASTPTYLGFGFTIMSWVLQLVVTFGIPFAPSYKERSGGVWYYLFAAFPPATFTKVVNDLGFASATDDLGLRWQDRYSYCQNFRNRPQEEEDEFVISNLDRYTDDDCVMSVGEAFESYVALYFIFLLIAAYMDQVLPNEYGNWRNPWFIFSGNYWAPQLIDRIKTKAAKDASDDGRQARYLALQKHIKAPLERTVTGVNGINDDVREEEEKMKERKSTNLQLSPGRSSTTSDRVEVYGLQKWFGSPLQSRDKRFQAIKESWFSIQEGTIFALLGPNGAGKTTTINCLTGIIPSSGGDAIINNELLSSAGGLDRIRSVMGVCPQFDILWGELTAREHLQIYGLVKGIPPKQVLQQADELLEKVKLTYAANQRAGSFSGGMKRRLSVAVALLGDPKIVYLDEPTTGMDPIARRYVWDIVEEAKKDRAIILTSHSMEEADILGDRIAIMAKGRIRAIGSSVRLKQKYGAGYQLSISVLPPNGGLSPEEIQQRAEDVKRFVRQQMEIEASQENRAYIQFTIPRAKETTLGAFMEELEGLKEELKITDIQLSLTTLEEVFLQIAKQAEVEAARSGPAKMQLISLPEGRTVRVRVGDDTVTDPFTQKVYNVQWGSDEHGELSVAGIAPQDNPQQFTAVDVELENTGQRSFRRQGSTQSGSFRAQSGSFRAVEMQRQ